MTARTHDWPATGLRIRHRKPTDQVLLDLFRNRSTSQISDALGRLPGTSRLLPMHREGQLLGFAFPLKVRTGDNLMIHRALQLAKPDDVLVIDGGGELDRALVGEIMKRIAQSRGIRGFIVDGAVRDIAAFKSDTFPCYARGVCLRGPYKNGPGEIGFPVVVGGQLVSQGDIIVGDSDGVIAVPASQAQSIAAAADEIEQKEARILDAIQAGTYDDTWIQVALAGLGGVVEEPTADAHVTRDRAKAQ